MIILGIDPGFARMGWGVISKTGPKFSLIDYGCLETSSESDLADRQEMIFDGISKVIKKYKPDLAGVETLFFNTNAKTAVKVGEARGVILLALKKSGIKSTDLTPLQVKQAVSGYGRAEKSQVQKMVKALLNLKQIPRPDDAADALAVALAAGSTRL
ncbi:MAG: Crossover junction endodeoxyribonuclease RuvC [Parcubacteria group bacterium GW2011_GWA2_42_28]|nr:MAG: Crossover junction endodeoxyribonuclease RuvC [Parcubacteria group bacterium GW2011_GWA2_42_28]